jgi:hypothetical protein
MVSKKNINGVRQQQHSRSSVAFWFELSADSLLVPRVCLFFKSCSKSGTVAEAEDIFIDYQVFSGAHSQSIVGTARWFQQCPVFLTVPMSESANCGLVPVRNQHTCD